MSRYGMSFARQHIEQGDYEEAILAATKEIEGGSAAPDPWFDRGQANELLERFVAAVADFERAIEIDRASLEMDPFALDDAYFSALLAAARAEPVAEGLARLARYRALLPEGAHVAESLDWERRLRGELPSLLDKTRGVAG